MIPLIKTGELKERINFVFISDGYSKADHDAGKPYKDAISKAAGFLTLSPWNLYAGHFNFWLVPEVSVDSGITKTVNGVRVVKNTALGSELGWGGQARKLGARDILMVRTKYGYLLQGSRGVFTILANDGSYGGGEFAGVATTTRGAPVGLFAHEMGGHAFADLADEYQSAMLTNIPEGKCNVATSIDRLPWKEMIAPGTPIPTPSTFGKVGAVKRGRGFVPQGTCLMNDVNKKPCAVCENKIIKTIMSP